MRVQPPLHNRKLIWFFALGKMKRVLVIATMCLISTGICVSQDASSRTAGEVLIERSSVTTPETGVVNFGIGTLYVPENRTVGAAGKETSS